MNEQPTCTTRPNGHRRRLVRLASVATSLLIGMGVFAGTANAAPTVVQPTLDMGECSTDYDLVLLSAGRLSLSPKYQSMVPDGQPGSTFVAVVACPDGPGFTTDIVPQSSVV